MVSDVPVVEMGDVLSCQFLAEAVLVGAGFFGGEGAVDEDGEGELVTVGGCNVASKGDDAFEGAGLGVDIAIGWTCLHTLVEGAINTCDGQCGKEGLIDGRVFVGVAEEGYLGIGGDVVVEGHATAISHFDA